MSKTGKSLPKKLKPKGRGKGETANARRSKLISQDTEIPEEGSETRIIDEVFIRENQERFEEAGWEVSEDIYPLLIESYQKWGEEIFEDSFSVEMKLKEEESQKELLAKAMEIESLRKQVEDLQTVNKKASHWSSPMPQGQEGGGVTPFPVNNVITQVSASIPMLGSLKRQDLKTWLEKMSSLKLANVSVQVEQTMTMRLASMITRELVSMDMLTEEELARSVKDLDGNPADNNCWTHLEWQVLKIRLENAFNLKGRYDVNDLRSIEDQFKENKLELVSGRGDETNQRIMQAWVEVMYQILEKCDKEPSLAIDASDADIKEHEVFIAYIIKECMNKNVIPTKGLIETYKKLSERPKSVGGMLAKMQSLVLEQTSVVLNGLNYLGVGKDEVLTSSKASHDKKRGREKETTTRDVKPKLVEKKEMKAGIQEGTCNHCGSFRHLAPGCNLRAHPESNKDGKVPWNESEMGRKWKARSMSMSHASPKFRLDGTLWKDAPPLKTPDKPKGTGFKGKECQQLCCLSECVKCDWGDEREVHDLNHIPDPIISTNHSVGFLICRKQVRRVTYLMDSGAVIGNYISIRVYEWLKKLKEEVHQTNVVVKGVFDKEGIRSKGKVHIQMCIPYSVCEDKLNKRFFDLKLSDITPEQYLTFDMVAEVVPTKYDVIIGAPIMQQLRKLKDTRCDDILDRGPPSPVGFGRAQRSQAAYESDMLTARSQSKERELGSNGQNDQTDGHEGVKTLKDLLGWVPETDEVDDFPDEPELQDVNTLENGENEEEFMQFIYAVDEGLREPEKEPGTSIPPAIYGSSDFVRKAKKLCEKHGVFSDKLKKEPAYLTPYAMEIDKEIWERKRNRGKPRCLGRQKNAIMKLFVDALLKGGVIEDATEAVYHSFAHLVLKGNPNRDDMVNKTPEELVEHYRMVIDSRALNEATKRTLEFPMPTVKDIMSNIAEERNEVYSKFDLTKGYWQVELHRDSRLYTAFMTSEGVYQWVRLPMGLRGAPSHFQHLMRTQVLKGIWKKGLEAYMDDILLGTKTEEEMLVRLDELFATLAKHNVTLNPKKTQIGLTEVEFIGHTVNRNGITFSREKIAEVVGKDRPLHDVQLKSFVGLVNYFSSHIKNFSTAMGPINALLKGYVKGKPKLVQWTDESNAAFNNVKELVNAIPVLFFPSSEGEIVVETDASDWGIGGWCYQIVRETNDKGEEVEIKQPIAFVSQALLAGQYKWNTHKKEAYAVNMVLQKLDYLLCGVRFRLRTDHKNLIYIKENADDMVQRWKMRIQHYDCDVEHVPGEENEVADGLSRMVKVHMESEHTVHLIDNFLIPEEMRVLLERCHNDNIGHSGVKRTVEKMVRLMVENGVKGTNVRKYVSAYIARCPVCQRNQLNRLKVLSEDFQIEAYEPWQRGAFDLITGLPDDGYGNTILLVGIDCLTRYVVLYPLKTGSAKEVAQKMLVNAGMFGCTCQILVDNGSEFDNEVVHELNRMVGSTVIHTVPYSHQQNGIVERVNKEIMGWVRDRFVNDDEDLKWGDWYPLIARALNGSIGFACGVSPATMLFGNMVDMDRVLLRNPSTTGEVVKVSEYMQKLLKIQEKILEAVNLRQEDKIKHKELSRNCDAISTTVTKEKKQTSKIGAVAIQPGDYVRLRGAEAY